MQQKLTHLETAFREFVEHESDHVHELQSQLAEVREGGVALQASMQEQAGHMRDVEEHVHTLGTRVMAVEKVVSASSGSTGWQSNRDRNQSDEEDNPQVVTV